MKLRNKKTGETFNAVIRESSDGDDDYEIVVCDLDAYERLKGKGSPLKSHVVISERYESLAELNEEWEDYTPAEPLIKDEKIRKAVRAWAEVCEIESDDAIMISGLAPAFTRFYTSMYGIDIKTESSLGLDEHKDYTIDELCGEEEE